jgi:hypothetical protein
MIDFKDKTNFELFVMDLCEKAEAKSSKDLSILSDELHCSIEIAIQDYIHDDENLDFDDYDACY